MDLTTIIAKEDDLQGYFEPGSKPRERWGIGIEYERFGVFRDTGLPIPYDGPASVETILRRLVGDRGWAPYEEDGRIFGASKGNTRITLEPGGQMELSGAVQRSLADAREELMGFVTEVDDLSQPLGIAWLGVGLHPIASLDSIGWIPKSRYTIMREYLPRRGSQAHVMMKQTACIQINLDYGSEADAMDKMRTAMGLSPLITALYANSPLTEGRVNGMMTARALAWRDTDPDRCGILPFVFKDGAGFGDYLDYALDVPMFFVAQGEDLKPAHGMTFRKFIRKGFEGRRATVADFQTHLTTLFPEVRLKHYIEVRGADSGDPASCLALAALWKGLLYDGASRRSAWGLVRDMSVRERNHLLDDVCKAGPAARLPIGESRDDDGARTGALVRDVLTDLVRLARQGLNNQGVPEEAAFLDPLDRRLGGEGGCPAHRLAREWDGPMKKDPRLLVESLSRTGLDGL
jgi:glutamate--cysteine ligase